MDRIAIEGTTYPCFYVWQNDHFVVAYDQGNRMTPSNVTLTDTGDAAMNQVARKSVNTVSAVQPVPSKNKKAVQPAILIQRNTSTPTNIKEQEFLTYSDNLPGVVIKVTGQEIKITITKDKIEVEAKQALNTHASHPQKVEAKKARNPHPCHPEHKLELQDNQKVYTCDGCDVKGFGPTYRCDKCNFDLHGDCFSASPTTCHDFYGNSTFNLLMKPPKCALNCKAKNCKKCKRWCAACAQPINGLVYHCEEKGLDLHPRCHNLGSELDIDGVKFRLCNDEMKSSCILCEKEKCSVGIRGWFYVSECKTYRFHVYCGTKKVLDKFNNGDTIDDNNCFALEKRDMRIKRKKSGKGGTDNIYWRMAKLFLKTIASILLGDPISLIFLVMEYLLA